MKNMDRRRFIYCGASGLMVPSILNAIVPIPFSFFKQSVSSGASTDSEVLDWAARVTANGGTYDDTSITAQDTAIKIIKAAGQRSLLLRWNLYCGTNLAACRTPLIIDKGSSIDSNNGFPSTAFQESDYSQATGLTATGIAGGTGKYLGTGFTPNVDWSDDNNCSMGAYLRTTNSDSDVVMGASSSNVDYLLVSYGGSTTYGSLHGTGSQQSFADTNGLGHYMVVRRASNDLKVYKNGVSQVSTTTPDGNRTSVELLVHCYNALAPAFSKRTIGGYELCAGMTSGEAAVQYNAVQAAQTIMSRQV